MSKKSSKFGEIITCKWCGFQRRIGGPQKGDTGSLTWTHRSYGCGSKSPKQLWADYIVALRTRKGKRLAIATYRSCGHKAKIEVSIQHKGDVVRSGSCPICNITHNLFGGVGDASDALED